MGKPLIQQRRGKGSIFKSPGHKFKGQAKLPKLNATSGIVIDIINCPAHSAPLAEIRCDTGDICLMQAPEGIRITDEIKIGQGGLTNGNILALKDIPEGTSIFNIEQNPGDGGRYVRASGTFAKLTFKSEKLATITFPSKKTKSLQLDCRATIGVIAGGGRTDKPLLKAGNNFKKRKAKNQRYPKVCGISMNAVAHPFGGGSSTSKGRPLNARRFASAGEKVGKLKARRTGKKR